MLRRSEFSNGLNRSLSGAAPLRTALGGMSASVHLNGLSPSSSNALQGIMSRETDEVLKLKKQVSPLIFGLRS